MLAVFKTLCKKKYKTIISKWQKKSNLFRTFFFVLEIARFDVNTVGPLNTIGGRKYLPKRPFGCNNAK